MAGLGPEPGSVVGTTISDADARARELGIGGHPCTCTYEPEPMYPCLMSRSNDTYPMMILNFRL